MGEKEGGMSEYERDRLKRIEENRKMLDHLFPDGTSLSVNGHSRVRMGRPDKEHTPEMGGEGDSTCSSPGNGRVRTR